MEKRELICIGCPLGCAISAELEDGVVVSVTGNTCKKGDAYARQELTAPKRMVTTTVKLEGGGMLPVHTAEAVPKQSARAVAASLKGVTARRPVAAGDVVLENAAGTGIAVVASKSVG